jgi:hypothetical protein
MRRRSWISAVAIRTSVTVCIGPCSIYIYIYIYISCSRRAPPAASGPAGPAWEGGTCKRAHTHAHAHARAHARTHTHSWPRTRAHTLTAGHARAHTHTRTHTHARMHERTHARTHSGPALGDDEVHARAGHVVPDEQVVYFDCGGVYTYIHTYIYIYKERERG